MEYGVPLLLPRDACINAVNAVLRCQSCCLISSCILLKPVNIFSNCLRRRVATPFTFFCTVDPLREKSRFFFIPLQRMRIMKVRYKKFPIFDHCIASCWRTYHAYRFVFCSFKYTVSFCIVYLAGYRQ